MPHTLDESRVQEVIDKILEDDTKLTAWEADFMESIERQYARKAKLSEGQLEVLEKIWMKY